MDVKYSFPRYSQQFYRVPTKEQFADPDNLFALVYKAKEAMRKFGYTKRTMSGINCHGFNRIIRHFVITGAEHYNKEALDNFVNELYEDDSQDKASKDRHGRARKCAEILYRYHATGTFEWFTLSHRNVPMPSNRFMSILETYLFDCEKRQLYNAKSLSHRKHVIRRFMLTVEKLGYCSFKEMELSDIKNCMMEYIQLGSGKTCSLSTIRVFLRFLHTCGETTIDLSAAITVKASRRKKVLPGYTDAEIDSLFSMINRNTALGKREYAIVTTALFTGLRSCDIATLKRNDIDWRKNEINITQSKTGHPIKIWLNPEVGNTIADYILNARPSSDSPYIFLRHVRPYEALQSSSIARPVRKYAPKTYVDGKPLESRGLHALRRTFGIRLLRAEIPLHLISEMLGHHDMDSSKPYLAADEKGLRNCALPLITPNSIEGAVSVE